MGFESNCRLAEFNRGDGHRVSYLESRATLSGAKLGSGAEFCLGADLGVDLGQLASQSPTRSRDRQRIDIVDFQDHDDIENKEQVSRLFI